MCLSSYVVKKLPRRSIGTKILARHFQFSSRLYKKSFVIFTLLRMTYVKNQR